MTALFSQSWDNVKDPMKQGELFGTLQRLPPEMSYQPEFISRDEEGLLLAEIEKLPLHEAEYKEYTAKRRIISYGGSYDFSTNVLTPGEPIPPFLHQLRERCAAFAGIPASEFTHALIAEYKVGTPLGWHRDVPEFEIVVGVSLGAACRMRLRRYPPKPDTKKETLAIELEPRSAYVMRGEARWSWQHSIPPVKSNRYSITFRSRSRRRRHSLS